MSTDPFKQVLFNDGEGLTFEDLNNVERFLESKLWDQVFQNSIPRGSTTFTGESPDPQFGGQDGADHPTYRAYCLNPGQAFLRPGSAREKVQIAPGTLLQKLAATDGNDPKLVAFTFAGTEEFTIADGDATHPRVDLLQMALSYVSDDSQSRDFEDATTHVVTTTTDNKKRQIQCTISVKQGTPAVSPLVPDPDTGYCAVGTVMVGETWVHTGLGATNLVYGQDVVSSGNATVQDQRMPIGKVRAYKTNLFDNHNIKAFVAPSGDPQVVTLRVNAADAVTNASGPTLATTYLNNWAFQSQTGRLVYPVDVPLGSTITGYSLHIIKTSTSGTISAQLIKVNSNQVNAASAVETLLGAGSTYPGSSGYTELSETGLSVAVTNNQEMFFLIVTGGGVVTTFTDRAFHLDVTYVSNQAATDFWHANNATNELWIPCPVVGNGRLVGIGLSHYDNTVAVTGLSLCQVVGGDSLGSVAELNSFSTAFSSPSNLIVEQVDFVNFENHHAPTAGPVIQVSATNKIGMPVWVNGRRCPYEIGRLGLFTSGRLMEYLVVRIKNTTVTGGTSSNFGPVTFYVAEGI